MSSRANRRRLDASRRKIAARPAVAGVRAVHSDDCGCRCVCCGVEFGAGDVSVEVPHGLN